MKHEIKKVMKLADEVMTLCMFKYEAEEVDLSIRLTDGAYRLHFRFPGAMLTAEDLASLKKNLDIERNPELEDYYWQLAGEIENSSELALVAMMSDEADVQFDDGVLQIEIVRKVG